VNWEASSWLSFGLQGELEHDRVARNGDRIGELLSREDQERLRFPVGEFTLITARPAVTLDFRDDPVNPHRGLLLTGSAELTRDLYTEPAIDIFSLKVAGALSVYLPIAPRVTLALSARGGRIYRLLEGSTTIGPKRFFLGGTLSMRGFREDGVLPQDLRQQFHDQLDACARLINDLGCTASAKTLMAGRELFSDGGELFTLGKAELRFPGFGSFDFGVFGEAGNLWSQAQNHDLTQLRYVVGAGVRYNTPIGPLALDAGINLFPDELLNERYFNNVNFSIGLF
jgi:outer membrane protein assembly factor BamA